MEVSKNLLSPIKQLGNLPNNVWYTPPTSRTLKTPSKVDLEGEICRLQIELLEEAQGNKLLMEHLVFSLQNISGKQKTLQAKI